MTQETYYEMTFYFMVTSAKKYYEMTAIDLGKQQVLDADPKAIQQINFTGNLAREGNTNAIMFFVS